MRTKKFAIVGIMVALAIPPGAFMVQKMLRRMREAPESSGEARVTFNAVARQMARDRLFGVGINNYSLGTDGPYSEPFGNGLDRGGLCHNLYYLTLGETGILGLVALLILFATRFFEAIRFLARNPREDLRGIFMLGWLGGLLTLAFQSTLEWAPVQTSLGMTLFGLFGVAAAVVRMPASAPATRWRVTVRPGAPAPSFARTA
jgi:O-antigen ligase